MKSISEYYKSRPLWFKTFCRSTVSSYLLLSIIEIISLNLKLFNNVFKNLNEDLSIFGILTLYCIMLIIRILLHPHIIKTVSLTILNYFFGFIILITVNLIFENSSLTSYILNNSPILNYCNSLLLQLKDKNDLVQLITICLILTVYFFIGAKIVTKIFIHYCSNTQLGKSLNEKIQYQSIFLVIIFIVTLLFSAIVTIFYSKVIATLIGTLFLFLLHTIIKNVLPILRELDYPSLKVEYESSILGKIILCLIDISSAFLVFAYGLAQLITNKFTVFLNVKKHSSLYSEISTNISLPKSTYIDHIQDQTLLSMRLSEENKFWLIFIGIFLLEGIISLLIFFLLKKDRKKFDIVHSYIDKLTIKK